jgi:hypothetical protein
MNCTLKHDEATATTKKQQTANRHQHNLIFRDDSDFPTSILKIPVKMKMTPRQPFASKKLLRTKITILYLWKMGWICTHKCFVGILSTHWDSHEWYLSLFSGYTPHFAVVCTAFIWRWGFRQGSGRGGGGGG